MVYANVHNLDNKLLEKLEKSVLKVVFAEQLVQSQSTTPPLRIKTFLNRVSKYLSQIKIEALLITDDKLDILEDNQFIINIKVKWRLIGALEQLLQNFEKYKIPLDDYIVIIYVINHINGADKNKIVLFVKNE